MSEIKQPEKSVSTLSDEMPLEGDAARVEETKFSPKKTPQFFTLTTLGNFFKTVIYRLYRLTGELCAIVLGLAFVWLCGVNMLIAQRVADVSFLESDAARLFAGAFDGKSADVGQMTLAWEAADNTLIFRARDISVNTKSGDPLNALSYVETELALRDVARGKIDPIRVVVDGGELSFVRDEVGNFVAGLGTPDTVGEFGPVWRGEKNDGDNDLSIGRIKSLEIRNAKVYVRDAGSDYKAQLRDTEMSVAFVPDAIIFDIAALLLKETEDSASIAASAPLNFAGRVSPDLRNIDINFDSDDFNPSKLLPRLDELDVLLGLNAPLDLKVNAVAARGDGLQKLNADIDVGRGTLLRNGTSYSFGSARAKTGYDPSAETLKVSDINLSSDLLSLRGRANISNLGAIADGLFSKDTKFEGDFDRLSWDGEAISIEPITLTELTFSGQLERDRNRVVMDTLSADFGDFRPQLSTSLTRDGQGKLLAASIVGRIDGTVSRDQLLAIWPKNKIVGARNWIERSILQATISNLHVRFDANEAVLSGEPLKDPDLTLTFDLNNGIVRYISTMTPATNVTGKGRLLGNQVSFDITTGQIDDVVLERGTVNIPRIYPYGGDLVVEGKGQGPIPTLAGLLDQKPFELVTPYGVSPNDFSGQGDITFSLTRPLRSKITYEQVKYEVSGTLNDVTAPFAIGKNKLTDGNVILLANPQGVSVKGPVNIGPWQTDLTWREVFDRGATPTRYQVNGRLSQSDLDSFGIGLREFMGGGDIILSIDAEADGLAISKAKLKADLSETDMKIGPYWSKPAGVDAMMTSDMTLSKDKQLRLDNLSLKSQGLNLEGGLDIGADFKLRDLNFSTAKIVGFIDAAVQLKPSPDAERFDAYITGEFLDVSPTVDTAFTGEGSGVDVPVLLTGSIKRLILDETYVVNGATFLFGHNGIGVTEARLKGKALAGPLALNLTTDVDSNLRTLTMDVPDASDAAFALFNLQSLEGGRLELDADLPAVGTDGPLTGDIRLTDVKIVNAPILATMLSLGSLSALTNALGGDGLKMEKVTIPFSYQKGQFSVREGRASGPGLGMTGNGEVNFGNDTLDMDGVLVPAYTANSMLGDIPIIGDIFVGKKGEGIFALNYTVIGEFEAAQVAVNPLSALTPGFLRGIFSKQRDDLPEQLREQIEDVRPVKELTEKPE